MKTASERLTSELLAMKPLRQGPDFFAGESPSAIVLDLMLNQSVGVERATAVNLAIHEHFERVFANTAETVGQASAWPYSNQMLRRSAKAVFNKLLALEKERGRKAWLQTSLSDLTPGTIGALASLERYLNRQNNFFAPLRSTQLDSAHLRTLTGDELFSDITPVILNPKTIEKQLASSVAVLELLEAGVPMSTEELRRHLRGLDQIGPESADTLILYVFDRPTIIADTYLTRIAYRHYIAEKQSNRRSVKNTLAPLLQTTDDAHRLHARANEIGISHCFAREPDCDTCPLRDLPHRA